MGRKSSYSEEEIDAILSMLIDGRSASYIGGKIGKSKAAITGIVYRNDRFRKAGLTKKKKKFTAIQPLREKETDSPQEDFNSLSLPLADLKSQQCRYGVNDPSPGGLHLFCGRQTPFGSPWCSHHQGVVYDRKRV